MFEDQYAVSEAVVHNGICYILLLAGEYVLHPVLMFALGGFLPWKSLCPGVCFFNIGHSDCRSFLPCLFPCAFVGLFV